VTRYLLDTHSFLWTLSDDPQLSSRAREIVSLTLPVKSESSLLVSLASLWEIAIKISRGRLTLGCSLEQMTLQAREAGMTLWPLQAQHVTCVATLPFHHGDPFDRVIAAQCLLDDLTLVSKDLIFDSYGVRRIW